MAQTENEHPKADEKSADTAQEPAKKPAAKPATPAQPDVEQPYPSQAEADAMLMGTYRNRAIKSE